MGRLLSNVTRPKKEDILIGYFPCIQDPPENVYPLLRLSISTTNSIWPIFFFKNVCQNNLNIEYFIKCRFSYD